MRWIVPTLLCVSACATHPSISVGTVSSRVALLPWTHLADDPAGDGLKDAAPDGKAFAYAIDTLGDSLWFRLTTHQPVGSLPAVSVALDTDSDSTNGAKWYGSNRSFYVDLMLSVGPTDVRAGAFRGYSGLTNAEGIRDRDWLNVSQGTVALRVDSDRTALYLGISLKDLPVAAERVRAIGSVGSNATWNDDIGARGSSASIDLPARASASK